MTQEKTDLVAKDSGSDLVIHVDTRPEAASGAGVIYVFLPCIYLAVTLLGGLRLGSIDNSFIFLKPALICLVLATVMLLVFVRSGILDISSWLSTNVSALILVANIAILLTVFTATVQVLNSLLPERGLPFLVVSFCFVWTLWNSLFAELTPPRMLRSVVALLGIAFVTKYLILANLTATSDATWLQRILENPTKEAFTWALDLPRYSAGTGYIQFFTLLLYMIGLYLTPRSPKI